MLHYRNIKFMKKLFLTLIAIALLISCNQKKVSKKQENTKTEIKTAKATPESKTPEREYKTKTGKSFIISEVKQSASISKITITPKGFTAVNRPLEMEESDLFDYALVADVNKDGFEELYIITRGTGSGSYAQVYGFASNKDKSVTPIYIPKLSDDDFVALFQGYMGHDKFYTEDNKLLRKYPIYNKEDSNNNPTGGDKIIEYELKEGESSWVLNIKK